MYEWNVVKSITKGQAECNMRFSTTRMDQGKWYGLLGSGEFPSHRPTMELAFHGTIIIFRKFVLFYKGKELSTLEKLDAL